MDKADDGADSYVVDNFLLNVGREGKLAESCTESLSIGNTTRAVGNEQSK